MICPEHIHIYPVYGRNKTTHITKKHLDCWCNPEVKQVCPESDDKGSCEENCFKCGGSGLVDPFELGNHLIIHKEHQLHEYHLGGK